jgi:hypothetical protein
MRAWARRTWRRAEELAGTRQGAALLVAASLVVYVIQSLGWPMAPGRDLESYLAVYADFWHTDAVFPWEMLSRVPVPPLVAGSILDLGSPFLVEVFGAVLFAGSILLYARTALLFGRGPAVIVGVALVLYPGYGVVFHELASEIVFAAGFAVWTAVVVRAALFASTWWFAAAGAATGLIALTRPANQVFLIVALLGLLLAGSWRARVGRTLAFAGVAVALLGAWAATNLWRYDDLTVARGGQASLPFFRAFTVDRIVDPDNGPASRELAAAVQRELLTKEPYRSYGIDLATFFSRGSPREHEDLISLSDRLWGWDSDYEVLGRAAREAVREHPGKFARSVLGDLGRELSKPLFAGRVAPPPAASASGTATTAAAAPAPTTAAPPAPPTVVVRGRELPEPTEGEPIPSEYQSAQISTPDGSIREVWTSPTEHHVVFDDPAKRARWTANDARVAGLYGAFPDRWWSPWLGLQMDRSSKLYPPPWLWLVAGAVGVALRRPRSWWATLAPVLGALVLLLATVMAVWAEPAYAVPVAPAFVLFAAVGLLGERTRRAAGATSTTSTPSSSAFRPRR